jgi:hypothetical protein
MAYEYINLSNGKMESIPYNQRTIKIGDLDSSISNKKLSKYKADAKKRNLEFLLSGDEFRSRIFDSCFYCGESPHQKVYSNDKKHYTFCNGIDRRDNDEGYTTENTVPCCAQCNHAKNKYTEEEFYSHIKACYEFLNLSEYDPSMISDRIETSELELEDSISHL